MELIADEPEIKPSLHSHLHLPMQSQIALMFMAVMVLFAVFASLLNSYIVTNSFKDDLDAKAGQYIQYIFNTYIENIDDINAPKFRSNLRKIIRDTDIISISLYDKNKSIFFRLGKESEVKDSVFEWGTDGNVSTTTHGDTRYYSYFVPLAFRNDYNIKNKSSKNVLFDKAKDPQELNYILLGFDGAGVTRTALNAFVWTFLLTILASICMMFIAVIVIRNFTKPFDRLSSAMAKAQSGVGGVRVTPEGASEIYSMGMAFNSMISVLEGREERLLTQKKVLEDEIKERELAELALKNTTSRLQAVFQNAVDGIIVINEDYKIVSINPSARKIYDYGEEELIGEDFSKIMQDRFIRMILGACKEGVTIGDGGYKATAVTKSGSEISVEIGVSLMPSLEHIDYLVIVRDISERIKVEKELNNYQLHLEAMVEEQTKDIANARDAAMAGEKAMSAFLSNMSHELRTPMHGVLSYASIALKKVGKVPPEKTKEYLGEIKTSGEHLLDIINDLLDLSKMKAGKMIYHHANKSFVDTIERMNREISSLANDRNIELDFLVYGKEVGSYFDDKRITQVFRNLYANAIKFSDSNSAIEIIADFRDSGKFVFSIFNFGPCVPDGEGLVIFDSFSQSSKTDTHSGGTGLGLSICKEIIESGHSGKIWAEPEVSNGAKFIIEIPLPISAISDS